MAIANDGMDFVFGERYDDAKIKIANATRCAMELAYCYCIHSQLTDFVFTLSDGKKIRNTKHQQQIVYTIDYKENKIIWQT